jgi:hypothetical protein
MLIVSMGSVKICPSNMVKFTKTKKKLKELGVIFVS